MAVDTMPAPTPTPALTYMHTHAFISLIMNPTFAAAELGRFGTDAHFPLSRP